jgi:hypothetical protein
MILGEFLDSEVELTMILRESSSSEIDLELMHDSSELERLHIAIAQDASTVEQLRDASMMAAICMQPTSSCTCDPVTASACHWSNVWTVSHLTCTVCVPVVYPFCVDMYSTFANLAA